MIFTILLLEGGLAALTSRAAEAPIPDVIAKRELNVALAETIDATNARDFARQSGFYPYHMEAFSLWRDVPRAAVPGEKRPLFDRVDRARAIVITPTRFSSTRSSY